MNLIDWDDAFCIGNEQIDNQHKKLVQILNDFYHSIENNNDKIEISQCLADLADYTCYHFESEESLFSTSIYPKKEEHKADHQEFIDQIIIWQNAYQQGKGIISEDILDYLVTWILNHINKTDTEMGKWI